MRRRRRHSSLQDQTKNFPPIFFLKLYFKNSLKPVSMYLNFSGVCLCRLWHSPVRLTWLPFCHTSKACTPNPLFSAAVMDAPSAVPPISLSPDRPKMLIPPLLHGTTALLHLGWRKICRAGPGSTSSSQLPAIVLAARPMSLFLPELSRSTGWWNVLPAGASFLMISSRSKASSLRLCPPLFPISCCTSPSRSCVRHTIRRGVLQFWIV